MADTTLTASCHCHATHFTLTLPTNILPLKVHLCHCTVCRTTHGAPCSFHAPIPQGIEPFFVAPSNLDRLTGYVHTNAKSTRYFCSTCGCHIGDKDHQGRWYISVSIFVEGNSGFWQIGSHAYTHSTRDGGVSNLLREIDGRAVEVWNPEDEPADDTLPQAEDKHQLGNEGEGREQELLAQCNCGGISMKISRPRDAYLASSESRGWVHRLSETDTRWLALVDLCSDCRLVTGTHLTTWLFVPRSHIFPAIPDNLLIGTAKSYRSSEGVLRTFCGTCGATVFVSQSSQGSDVVDIATGILRSREGVMLGSWAWWRSIEGGFPKDGLEYDEGFARALMEGLAAWRGLRRDIWI